MSTRLFIVDDHTAIRKGLDYLLQPHGFRLVLEAGSVKEALNTWYTADWDVGILDINLPDGEGIELVSELRSRGCSAPILVHSMRADKEVGMRVLKAGGNGFVNKGSDPTELVKAVETVAGGGVYMSQELSLMLATQVKDGKPAEPIESLSSREKQVLKMMAEGLTLTEISEKLECHVNTISTYRARLLKKLSLRTTLDLIRYAVSHDLA